MVKWFLIGGLVGLMLKEISKEISNTTKLWHKLDEEWWSEFERAISDEID